MLSGVLKCLLVPQLRVVHEEALGREWVSSLAENHLFELLLKSNEINLLLVRPGSKDLIEKIVNS